MRWWRRRGRGAVWRRRDVVRGATSRGGAERDQGRGGHAGEASQRLCVMHAVDGACETRARLVLLAWRVVLHASTGRWGRGARNAQRRTASGLPLCDFNLRNYIIFSSMFLMYIELDVDRSCCSSNTTTFKIALTRSPLPRSTSSPHSHARTCTAPTCAAAPPSPSDVPPVARLAPRDQETVTPPSVPPPPSTH